MIHLSQRTLRGFAEAVGIPSVIGGITAILLFLHQLFGTGA